jgi:carbon storage regulator CsrA
MLVLSRQKDETIIIGDDIKITVVTIFEATGETRRLRPQIDLRPP